MSRPTLGGHADADVVLNPAARLLWRSAHVVQLELGSRAVVITGLDERAVRRLTDQPMTGNHQPDPALTAVIRTLRASGFVVRRARPAEPGSERQAASALVPRLAADLAALTARYGDKAGAAFAARRRSAVRVHGSSRLAASVASLLAAAGIGAVEVAGRGDARLYHAAPGGLLPADEGRRYVEAVADAVRRAAPEASFGAGATDRPVRLAVLVGEGPVDDDLRIGLHVRGTAHLAARVGADFGVIGPLVEPGRTSCLRCADLHRSDRDSAWGALAVQLSVPSRHAPPSDVALNAFVASVVALQALAFLDGGTSTTRFGTLELHLPGWQLRRRSWPPHPGCDCGAYGAVSRHSAQ
jgi:bacteriocin biosynthesis cyclodehydratase domain-containing protein